jgi:hypothetical protein
MNQDIDTRLYFSRISAILDEIYVVKTPGLA